MSARAKSVRRIRAVLEVDERYCHLYAPKAGIIGWRRSAVSAACRCSVERYPSGEARLAIDGGAALISTLRSALERALRSG